jgi:hypothetical protein
MMVVRRRGHRAGLRWLWVAPGRLDELRAWLRPAYVEGAEEWTPENVGRRMSANELQRVVARLPNGR